MPHKGVESLPVNDQSLLVVVMTSNLHARTMRWYGTYLCAGHDSRNRRRRNLPGAHLVHVPARYGVLDTIMRNHVPTAVS